MPDANTTAAPKKIVLAYSGGLDTSVILPGSRSDTRAWSWSPSPPS